MTTAAQIKHLIPQGETTSDSVAGSSYKDISETMLKNFLFKRYTEELIKAGIFGHLVQSTDIEEIVQAIDTNFTIEKLLKNCSLMDEAGQLTLSGLLLLGKSIQRYRPVFTIKGVSFVGNSVATTEFRDKLPDREVEGNLLKQYETAISFINRNLKTVQVEKEFNSAGQLEIPLEVFVETLTNALIHRDYYINSPIRLFIFDNRIEIHSPGILPDSVTEETIKQGISVPRNQLLFDNAQHLLPYTGIGSGIMRVLQRYDKIFFKNNIATEEFIITILRDETLEDISEGINNERINNENEGINNENEGINNERINSVNGGVKQKNSGVKQKNSGVNGGVKQKNSGVNGGVSEVQQKILDLIKENQHISVMDIAERIGKPRRTIENNIKQLKDKKIIKRFGSDKTGGYQIITNQ